MAERVEKPMPDTSAANAAEDLSILFPDQKIKLANQDIIVQEYPFMKWLEIKPSCKELIDDLTQLINQNDILIDELLEFFEDNFTFIQCLLCESTGQSIEFLKQLTAEEAEVLLLTWWQVNKHFFLKSVGRQLRKQGKGKVSDGQISSSA